jgi:hypothetical protein
VNWLRAKARHQRWEEEVTILQNEMKWIKLFFQHQIQVWEARRNRATSMKKFGHQLFAAKQVWMWRKFLSDASHTFSDSLSKSTL